jgi:hypothetical protein
MYCVIYGCAGVVAMRFWRSWTTEFAFDFLLLTLSNASLLQCQPSEASEVDFFSGSVSLLRNRCKPLIPLLFGLSKNPLFIFILVLLTHGESVLAVGSLLPHSVMVTECATQ